MHHPRNLLLLSLLMACSGDKNADDSGTATGGGDGSGSDGTGDDGTGDDGTGDDGTGDDGGTTTDTAPLLAITSPAYGTTLDGSAVELKVEVQNFTITDDVGGSTVEGEGHLHVYVDGAYRDYATDPDSVWATRLSEGDHEVTVALANNDHSELDPAATDTIKVTVPAGTPGVEISAPTSSQSIDSSTWEVGVSVSNLTLDPDNIGGTNTSGEGHYHVYVDGVYQTASGEDSTWIFDQSAGDHILSVVLTENDHTETSSVDYIRVSAPTDRNDIQITSPANGDTVPSDFAVSVSAENFTFDPNAIGGSNVDGEGHWHVFVDDVYYGASGDGSIELSGIDAGTHTLRAELYNNDHTELKDRVFDEEVIKVE